MVQRNLKPALRQLKGCRELVGAEIGVYFGFHAEHYLEELDVKCVFLIDPYTKNNAEKRAHERLCKYERKIIWIKKTSIEAASFIPNELLDFVYIDGDHSCDSVMKDLVIYYPKLKKGGLLSGHDYDIPSVKNAVDRYIADASLDLHIGESGEIRGKEKYDFWIWKGKS